VRDRPGGFAEAALSAGERGRLPAEAADEWLLRCWCAKEAAGKALGSGLASAAAVTAVDVDRGDVELAAGDCRLLAHTLREGDLIVATVLHEEAVG
jgi:phosphopantetheinyl transferase